MAEYIGKDDVIKIILNHKDHFVYESDLDELLADIDIFPSANVEKIIRCKNCVWYRRDIDPPAEYIDGVHICQCIETGDEMYMYGTDYCSYAKERN